MGIEDYVALDDIGAWLHARAHTNPAPVGILGVSVPLGLVRLVGALVVVAAQLFALVHVHEEHRRLEARESGDPGALTLWGPLYGSSVARSLVRAHGAGTLSGVRQALQAAALGMGSRLGWFRKGFLIPSEHAICATTHRKPAFDIRQVCPDFVEKVREQ